jgi:hypothetical protein
MQPWAARRFCHATRSEVTARRCCGAWLRARAHAPAATRRGRRRRSGARGGRDAGALVHEVAGDPLQRLGARVHEAGGMARLSPAHQHRLVAIEVSRPGLAARHAIGLGHRQPTDEPDVVEALFLRHQPVGRTHAATPLGQPPAVAGVPTDALEQPEVGLVLFGAEVDHGLAFERRAMAGAGRGRRHGRARSDVAGSDEPPT